MDKQDFSFAFQVDKLGPNPKRIHIEATDEELTELKERFDLKSLDFFKGTVILKRLPRQKIEAIYEAKAKITQECVVTFKPVKNLINLEFQRIYEPLSKSPRDKKEVEIDIESTEDLDPIIDGVIDLGAALAEELGLEIDPFPRADDTNYGDYSVGPEITEEEIESSNPFAVLADLKNKSD